MATTGKSKPLGKAQKACASSLVSMCCLATRLVNWSIVPGQTHVGEDDTFYDTDQQPRVESRFVDSLVVGSTFIQTSSLLAAMSNAMRVQRYVRIRHW